MIMRQIAPDGKLWRKKFFREHVTNFQDVRAPLNL